MSTAITSLRATRDERPLAPEAVKIVEESPDLALRHLPSSDPVEILALPELPTSKAAQKASTLRANQHAAALAAHSLRSEARAELGGVASRARDAAAASIHAGKAPTLSPKQVEEYRDALARYELAEAAFVGLNPDAFEVERELMGSLSAQDCATVLACAYKLSAQEEAQKAFGRFGRHRPSPGRLMQILTDRRNPNGWT